MKSNDYKGNCAACERATPLSEGELLCSDKGIVSEDFSCKKFSPDPLKRNLERKPMTENTLPTPEKTKEFKTPLAPRRGIKGFWLDFYKNKKYLLLCFTLPFLLNLLMYICYETYPIGEGSVLVLDLNGQYVYFFEEFRNITEGDGSLLYSFSRGLGGEFMGIFAYYLSSPFTIIVSLFPREMITEALLLMFLLKTGLCGLTFGIYIEATRKRNRIATVIFSAMYALSGYAIVMQHNTMWIDCLIFLPIVLLGIESLIKYGKFKMLVISLSLTIFANFYIGFMVCIFVVIYYFYYYFSRSNEEINPRREDYHFIKSSLRMTLYCLIALAICAALLLCTYHSLTLGKTNFSKANYGWDQNYDWMDIVTKMFIGSYDTVRPEGMPFIYSGTLTLILLPLYFLAPKIKMREKAASAVVILIFITSFNLTKLDYMWHGLQRPNWLNHRYSFIFCFFIILLAYKAFENLREIGYKKVIASCVSVSAFLLVIQKMNYKHVDDFFTVWLSLGIIAIYLFTLRAVIVDKAHIKKAASLILCILVSVEMFGGGCLNMYALGQDVVYSTRTSYRNFIDVLYPITDAVRKEDTSFYRMEKTMHRKTNDPFALDMNGLSGSTSTLNEETIRLLNNFGLSSKSHWSKYLGGTPVSDTLFGVKYVLTKTYGDEVMELYEKCDFASDINSNYTVWENPYAMSLAAGVSPDIRNIDAEEYPSSFEYMNAVVGAMLGEGGPVEVFRAADVEEEVGLDNMLMSHMTTHIKFTPANGYSTGRVNYTIHIDTEDPLYLFIPSTIQRECFIYINGVKDGGYFGNETDRIIELGSFDIGETVTVSFENVSSDLYFMKDQQYFYYLDTETFDEYMPSLSDSSFMIHDYGDDHFKGTIDIAKGDTMVYTSIPYDEGWQIYLDGEKIEYEKLLSGLIGFEADEGEHILEMKYRPFSLYLGLGISTAGFIAFLCAWIITERKRKKDILAGRAVFEAPDLNMDSDFIPDSDYFDSDEEFSAIGEENASSEESETYSAIDENKIKYPPAPVEDAKNPDNTGENH